MNTQLVFGLMSGEVKADPFAVGDVLVTKHFGRVVVETVSEDIRGGVFVCVRQDNGATCVVLEREILWRSR